MNGQLEKKEDSKNTDDDIKVLGDQNGNRNKNVQIIDDDIGIVLKVSKVFSARLLGIYCKAIFSG